MKANEAPEKVYLLFNRPYLVDYTKLNKRRCDEEVEYTRTDAFIKKVSEWLKDCATFTDMNGKKCIDEEMYKTTFEDFVNYMKGE